MKKFLAFLAFLAALIWAAVFYFPDNKLHLVFCDVGQGDAILVKKGFSQVLIDGGPDEKVLACLSENLPFWDRTLEMVVLTHPQADHLTGLISVLERYNVKYFVINNTINDSKAFWRFREALIEEGSEIYNPEAGEKMRMAKINFTALWPKEKFGDPLVWQKETSEKILGASAYSGNFNETSIVLLLSYGDFEALLTGDVPSSVEKKIELGEAEVLKIAHHGSQYSTTEEFLEKVRPDLAIISVGKNSFGHPSEEVIGRLGDLGIRILRTDQNGEIEIVSDGKRWYTLVED